MRDESKAAIRVPNHISFIPDGNRRYAKVKKIPLGEAYRMGAQRVLEAAGWARDRGVRHVSFFGISHDNVEKRTEVELEEVQAAALLFCDLAAENNLRIHAFGDLNAFKNDARRAPLYKRLMMFENTPRGDDEFVIHVAANYSGELDGNRAYSAGVPDVDLMIRTGGYQRLSGFLPMQHGYAEQYYSPVLWPQYTERLFGDAIHWFKNQDRNFGT